MNTFSSPKRDEGVALILALIFLIAMAILVAAMADRTGSQSNQVAAYVDFEETFDGMEAAIAIARAEINNQVGNASDEKDGLVGVDPSYNLSGPMPTFGMNGVTPLRMELMPSIEYYAVSYDWFTDGVDNNGDGITDDIDEEDWVSVYAFARGIVSSRRAEVILAGGNINVWKNAVFAGSGQAGNLINGNVSIHGSVHLLGTALNPGDPAISAIELSGTSLIHNNYDGLSAGLHDRIPALDLVSHGGQMVESLEAKLRVKNGMVSLSGNSEVGQVQDTGNTWKETMDGVYVNDGYTGNALDANGDPQTVHSDNGWNEGYDLGTAIPFPTFGDDGGVDHLAYYLETDPDPTVGLQQVFVGDMTIEAGEDFYWNSTTGDYVTGVAPGGVGMPNAADLNPDEFYIWFDATANQMMVNGRIPVDGNILLDSGNGNDDTFNYTGKGTMMAFDADSSGNAGDVAIEASLLSVNADGTTANSFPGNNLFGIQAEHDMVLGTSSQLELMGGFYAQNRIAMNKQSTLLGTIVGDYFDMGINVPDIYQIPELAEEWLMHMRMIGAGKVRFLSPVSWREMGVL